MIVCLLSNYDLSHVTYDLLLTGRTDEAQGKEQKIRQDYLSIQWHRDWYRLTETSRGGFLHVHYTGIYEEGECSKIPVI